MRRSEVNDVGILMWRRVTVDLLMICQKEGHLLSAECSEQVTDIMESETVEKVGSYCRSICSQPALPYRKSPHAITPVH